MCHGVRVGMDRGEPAGTKGTRRCRALAEQREQGRALPHPPQGELQTRHSVVMSSRGGFPSGFPLLTPRGGDKTPALLLPGGS